ncbi:divergent polysaccharide deacetylase family protein [Simiduia sp. 21SJ11W-1]|uniref:divergent polysaccharide deacetylase family protein n=1 Tax=Simiduia sp. 21SJ11W-1 TaxID=2909669 RepID=UPI00209F95D5|nr:divergent polysaccharide deacetylase family protein [Simiduia sp. 21SJ11W-1]UTA48463.1 divergent polysaccharide deacetylase family protein [Simiduia sp. 21SJ11W-1]
MPHPGRARRATRVINRAWRVLAFGIWVAQAPALEAQATGAQPTSQTTAATRTLGKLAIIIDDIGYQRATADALIALPYPISFAVLPVAPHSQALAKNAWLRGRDVLLHIPMATVNHAKLDPGGLPADLPATHIQRRLHAHFDAFPQAQGMNNHMGSLLTSQPLAMQAVMLALAERGKYFVDSKTSSQSVAFSLARQQGITTAERDVFLDNDQSPAAIRQQLHQAIALAQAQGYALAIGHPYPNTLAVLEAELAKLDKQVELVPLYSFLRHLSHNQTEVRHTQSVNWRLKTPWKQESAR